MINVIPAHQEVIVKQNILQDPTVPVWRDISAGRKPLPLRLTTPNRVVVLVRRVISAGVDSLSRKHVRKVHTDPDGSMLVLKTVFLVMAESIVER